MSKHTVTMKSLMDENAQLKIRLHKLETEIAVHWRKAGEDYDRRRFWRRLASVFRFKWGGAE